jgi:hypothetical protein
VSANSAISYCASLSNLFNFFTGQKVETHQLIISRESPYYRDLMLEDCGRRKAPLSEHRSKIAGHSFTMGVTKDRSWGFLNLEAQRSQGRSQGL